MEELAVALFIGAVKGVPYDGAAEVFEVDADLVSSSGAGAGQDQAIAVIAGEDLELGDRLSAVGEDGHLFPVDGVAPDGEIDGAAAGLSSANGEVHFFYPPRGEHLDELLVGQGRLSGDEDP